MYRPVYTGQTVPQLAASVRWKVNRKAYGVGTGFKHDMISNSLGDEIRPLTHMTIFAAHTEVGGKASHDLTEFTSFHLIGNTVKFSGSSGQRNP